MDTSELAKRMKDYESVPKTRLMKRCPVACRIDGKAHHSFTRGFKRPFDEVYIKSMQQTAKYLCENIQGVVLSYQQSDEITLILVDYKELNTSPYFDYEVQKLCSVIASMATMAFNKAFEKNVREWSEKEFPKNYLGHCIREIDGTLQPTIDLQNRYIASLNKGATFDARVFNIPKEEVMNLLYWRQIDATRNSIQMVGQANFSHNQLHGKNCSNIQDMLMLEKGINWNDYPTHLKRGSCCVKKPFKINEGTEQEAIRNKWVIDTEIPIFTQDKDYINKLIFI
jgi:tRNA(His) 5'-end guanylyltransferase